MLGHLIYYLVPKLEEVVEQVKDSLLWEEIKTVERCSEAIEKLKSKDVHTEV